LDKILIIGSGFSAALTKSYLKSGSIRIFSPNLYDFNSNLNNNLYFSNTLSHWKLCATVGGALSNHNFIAKSGNINLHNIIAQGGNSRIWGGFYDAEQNFNYTKHLNIIGAKLIKLDYHSTGSKSNNSGIVQLQDKQNKIYSADNYLNEIESKFVLKINVISSNNFEVIYLMPNDIKLKSERFNKIFICAGVINTISLLANSFNCKDFSLNDNPLNIKLVNLNSQFNDLKYSTSIRYTLLRAANHYLGLQFKNNLINYKGFYGIEQQFINGKSMKLNLNINQDQIHMNNYGEPFGKSIHYNNLHVSNTPVSVYLNNISSNIVIFGMASVNQNRGGPISNNIHKLINNYFCA